MATARSVVETAFIAATFACAFGPGVARADDPPVPAPDCSVVDSAAASRILGFPVDAADETSRSGGVCFFASRAVSDEGSVAYAIVTERDIPARRAFFRAMARRCAGVASAAPRAAMCASMVKLADVQTLDDYYAARTMGDATPVPELGSAATIANGALYVRRGARVFEATVMRGEDLDTARSTALAKALLERTPP